MEKNHTSKEPPLNTQSMVSPEAADAERKTRQSRSFLPNTTLAKNFSIV
jgi:hypothetical protein